jgi:putative ABC transport system ATP-binding protein
MMIELVEVRKGFNLGRPNEFIALDGVNLEIERNAVTVLKGPSGSGKTTLLSLIGCMTRPTAGRIRLHGLSPDLLQFAGRTGELEVTSMPERFLTFVRRRIFGFTFQQYNLIKGITVLENVMLPAYPSGVGYGELRERALRLLRLFAIDARAEAKVEWLSGGEAQRTAIARALINDPIAVIADEPTAHLDTKLSKEFMDIVSELKKAGKTVIIASHDPLVYDSGVVDRAVVIRDGKIEDGQG